MDDSEGENEQQQEQASVGIDQKKAEALLDNIREDRTRFMKFQARKDKKRGVQSGRNW